MSWLFSQALVEEYSEAISLDGEPCAPLNLMPTLRPFLLKDKMTEFCAPSQFGLTLRPLTANLGAELLMLFLAGFPVRTSAPLGKAPASKANDPGYGWRWRESFVKYDHASRSWKTRQCSLLGGLAEYSETWPRWGSMRDGECSAQPTPARRICANESGSWPTIRSSDGERGGRGDLIQSVRGNPNARHKRWQTPVADDAVDRVKGKLNSRGEPKLSAQVKLWPTPHGFSKDGRSNGPSWNELGRVVNQSLWPTPQARDWKDGKNPKRHGNHSPSVAVAESAPEMGGSLNPTWVEWLMGWPIGWTDCAPLEMAKFQAWQQWHGKF